MKILMISSYLPYPLFSGGHVRLFNILKELSKKHKITLICERRDYQTKEDEAVVRKYCDRLFTVPRVKQWSLRNILKTGISFYSFLLIGHTNKPMNRQIEELLDNEKFDLIHAETFYIMQNIPKTNIPVVLVEHNIEYLVYKRYADQSSIIAKTILYADVLKMKFWEKRFWKKAGRLVAVSEEEKKVMEREGIKYVSVIPNGVDTAEFKVQSTDWQTKFKVGGEKRILFLGDFKWVKNTDAAEWLIKDIWPLFVPMWNSIETKQEVKLWIVGRKIPEKIKKLGKNDKNIIFDEDAPSKTQDIFRKADLLIAPIRVGGGTSFKILEAMAMGVPVITTPLGIEGIKATPEKDVLVGSEASEIAAKMSKILHDEIIYREISKNARMLIEREYNWEKIVEELENVYNSLV